MLLMNTHPQIFKIRSITNHFCNLCHPAYDSQKADDSVLFLKLASIANMS